MKRKQENRQQFQERERERAEREEREEEEEEERRRIKEKEDKEEAARVSLHHGIATAFILPAFILPAWKSMQKRAEMEQLIQEKQNESQQGGPGYSAQGALSPDP